MRTETQLVVHIPFISETLVNSISSQIKTNENKKVEHFIEKSLVNEQFYDLTIDNIQSQKNIRKAWLKQILCFLPKDVKQSLKQKNLYLTVNSTLSKLYILTETQFQIMQKINSFF